MSESKSKPDYGIDAPGLLRFFFTFGAIALSMFLLVLLSSLLSHTLKIIACFIFGIVASYLLGMGCLMVYFSKVQKLKEREALLGLVQWSGSEIVLDIGCGRGLMLIGAAKRLTSGKAFGIDLWQQKDQASNSLEVTLTNAEIEGVADRIEVKTADMRQLPFSENYFDVVTSNWAVHNLEAEKDRQQALSEIMDLHRSLWMTHAANCGDVGFPAY